MASSYGPNLDKVKERATQYLESPVEHQYNAYLKLKKVMTPSYEQFLEHVIKQPNGMKFVIDMRSDLLDTLSEEKSQTLLDLDSSLHEILSNWVSYSFLEMRELTWDSPSSLLEKIIHYERVHPIANFESLKQRLTKPRSLYYFSHPLMPTEPLIFVQVSLQETVPNTMKQIFDNNGGSVAVFYSISSTQKGLRGIELGNFLIKRVVHKLSHESKNIKTFVTLSPIPGFSKWLTSKLHMNVQNGKFYDDSLLTPSEKDVLGRHPESALLELLESNRPEELQKLETMMMRLCVRYLYQEKKRRKALDPVANFHIRNGAQLFRVNWNADPSSRRYKESYGMMVNYKYDLDNIESNNRKYLLDDHITAGQSILDIVNK
ncbi:malonyl-CoA decarboxylase [Acrasis kona]